jgi:FKBP-type peptidyl-prolyl cis-trans isomerase FkpA
MRLTFIYLAIASMFFAIGCKKEEVKVTPSGYEYVMHTNSDGRKAKPGDYVYFHAQMRNGDSVFYASREMGATAPFLQIPTEEAELGLGSRKPSPVEEVLRLMAVGDSVTIFINIDTLPNKPPGFENAKVMYYDVVAIDIKNAEEFAIANEKQREEERVKREAAQARVPEIAAMVSKTISDYVGGKLGSQIKTTASGLKYILHDPGNGKPAKADKLVSVQYYGALRDGNMFDNSFERGVAFTFQLGKGQVIPGWDEGIALLKEGGKATLFIPAELGYGAAGSPPVIPENAELIFYVELEKAN